MPSPALLVVTLGLARFAPVAPADLAPGDIVTHTSRSRQALAVAVATHSTYTHIGVVVQEGDRLFVVEAAAKAQKTPLADFVRRGLSSTTVLRDQRLRDPAVRDAVQRAALALVGTPYDSAFAVGVDNLYCSELLVEAWRRAGLSLGVTQHVGELDLAAAPVRALLAARWQRHPACQRAQAKTLEACRAVVVAQPIVTPAGVARDPNLATLGDLPAT